MTRLKDLREEEPKKPAARWRRRKEARPSEILEAAMDVFAEKGLTGARMEDIAARAGVTKGTIYLYFANKAAVFQALVTEAIGERVKQAGAMVDAYEGPTPELMANVLRFIGAVLVTTNRAALPKLVIGEIAQFPELQEFYRRAVIDRGLAVWEKILKRGIARGEFRPVPTGHVARICIAPLLVAALWRTLFAQFDTEPYDIDGLIETHVDVLLRGLAADGASA
ncbi:MAG TPA: TetR/AcrR family transcriptional regulator [Rhizomicrobium sp.]|nr:TetR/AcrR family transcriptional regulator [Rhizomicrobium sp.]